ncbi:signal peptidase I [Arcanobacterium pinnipediorum]|uniref:Signal peptidase I n=1 Tax=Arcanobacterium pinnipediorum TaxID=1503041 RepID=A0ABY5AJI4_9ACTO|nr:signal peptidase I [Arcanobacterium pinnipediorum]USR79931.1 signal peptidase I [Arcanobacterium pinnipediorum]
MSSHDDAEFDAERYAPAPQEMPPSFEPESLEEARAQRLRIIVPDSQQTEVSLGRKILSSLLEIGTVLAIALLFSVILKTFFLQAFEIPSGSMEDTIIIDDRVIVNKLADSAEELNRGDIIVFLDPGHWLVGTTQQELSGWRGGVQTVGEALGLLPRNADSHLIKRLIGLPGDHVACCDDKGRVTVNGVGIDETYLKPGVSPSNEPFDVTVPRGHLWVMGDNRSDSSDSRYHHRVEGSGFVPIRNVEGRAWLRILPLSRFGQLPDASEVFEGVRAPKQ